MIAAFGDLDIGEVPRRRQHARRRVVIEVRLERIALGGLHALAESGDLLQFIGADHGVHFRHVLLNIAAIAFDQAPGDDQLLRAAGFLVLRHFENGVDRFLLGRIDEAARVDHDHVGVGRMRRQLVALRGELAHHHLGIDEVLRATETDKTNFQTRVLNVAVRLAALFEILLMIFFGAPELAGRDDLGHNRLRETSPARLRAMRALPLTAPANGRKSPSGTARPRPDPAG